MIRNGRRIYGGVYCLQDGREVYLAWRRTKDIFRSGEKTISDAVANGTACWAIDYDTLIRLRTEGVYLVGVINRDTNDIYIAMLGDFIAAKTLNYESRGGALQRYLPLSKFVVFMGSAHKKRKPTASRFA